MFGINRHHLLGAAVGIAAAKYGRPLLASLIALGMSANKKIHQIKEDVKENLEDLKAEANAKVERKVAQDQRSAEQKTE